MKEGVRSIGIDDGPFARDSKGDVLVVGAVFKGGTWFDGLLSTKVRKDGWNATDRLVSMLCASKFIRQLHYVILDGIAFGGFNVVDLDRLNKETGLKIMVSMRKMPDMRAVKKAVMNLSRWKSRWKMILSAGRIYPVGGIFCQLRGMDENEALELLKLTTTRSNLPEPLRAAHLIAGGLVRGQSGKRA